MEDAKSHFTENKSEFQPQHFRLEKETGEDGLESPANPNDVYAAVDNLKKKKSGSNDGKDDKDDSAAAVQISHVITDSGATYAACCA